jgi:hypothetical protein
VLTIFDTAAAQASSYAVAQGDNPNGAHGAQAYLCVDKLWLAEPWATNNAEHVNNTLWVGFDPTSGVFIGNYWTEAGIANGVYGGPHGSDNTNGTKRFYWADQSGQYGYNEHFDYNDVPTLGSSYYATVQYYSPPWWYVQVGPAYSSGSYHNTSVTSAINTGLETTSTNTSDVQETGSSRQIQWFDTSGTSHTGMPNATTYVNNPPYGTWYYDNTSWGDELGEGWTC